MDRESVLRTLRDHRGALQALGVGELYLFGSVARDEQRLDSDVDLLVEFNEPVGLVRFVGVLRFLEDALQRKVDLVDRRALRGPLKARILAEAIRAA